MTLIQGGDCDRPNCTGLAKKTYRGPHGNRLHLCERCYYKMVRRGGSSFGSFGKGDSRTIGVNRT